MLEYDGDLATRLKTKAYKELRSLVSKHEAEGTIINLTIKSKAEAKYPYVKYNTPITELRWEHLALTCKVNIEDELEDVAVLFKDISEIKIITKEDTICAFSTIKYQMREAMERLIKTLDSIC